MGRLTYKGLVPPDGPMFSERDAAQQQVSDMYARVRQVFPLNLLNTLDPQQRTLTDNAINRVLNNEGPKALTVDRLEGIKELVAQHLWSPALTEESKSLPPSAMGTTDLQNLPEDPAIRPLLTCNGVPRHLWPNSPITSAQATELIDRHGHQATKFFRQIAINWRGDLLTLQVTEDSWSLILAGEAVTFEELDDDDEITRRWLFNDEPEHSLIVDFGDPNHLRWLGQVADASITEIGGADQSLEFVAPSLSQPSLQSAKPSAEKLFKGQLQAKAAVRKVEEMFRKGVDLSGQETP